MNRQLAVVVLAAGQGKRMGADVPKVLVEARGRPLVEHVLLALEPLAADRTVIVYGHGGDLVQDALKGRGLSFAHQPEQNGTGHAVECALPALDGFVGDVLIVCGDTPLLTGAVLSGLVSDHRASGRAMTVLSAEVPEPGSLGRVLRDESGGLIAIRESADASPEELAVREINTGVMIVDSSLLAGALGRLDADNAQGEFYLTDVPVLLLGDGRAVGVSMTHDEGAALGVNTPEELAKAEAILADREEGR
ncbi:MAG: NTP transferase domain-containing protein [Planctomycetota bacterium]|jgi:bifunctional UDP-N-acetylglucosamine pyrophosphorylase/glucosamine-1-phosphate N-acetyltransferase